MGREEVHHCNSEQIRNSPLLFLNYGPGGSTSLQFRGNKELTTAPGVLSAHMQVWISFINCIAGRFVTRRRRKTIFLKTKRTSMIMKTPELTMNQCPRTHDYPTMQQYKHAVFFCELSPRQQRRVVLSLTGCITPIRVGR
jgi:hypothetical protein